MNTMHDELSGLLARDPFLPFELFTTDGRRIVVARRDQAVLNSAAISVIEAPFSVTVLGLDQLLRISRPD